MIKNVEIKVDIQNIDRCMCGFITVKKPKTNNNTVAVNVRISIEEHAQLLDMVDLLRTNINTYVAQAIEEFGLSIPDDGNGESDNLKIARHAYKVRKASRDGSTK